MIFAVLRVNEIWLLLEIQWTEFTVFTPCLVPKQFSALNVSKAICYSWWIAEANSITLAFKFTQKLAGFLHQPKSVPQTISSLCRYYGKCAQMHVVRSSWEHGNQPHLCSTCIKHNYCHICPQDTILLAHMIYSGSLQAHTSVVHASKIITCANVTRNVWHGHSSGGGVGPTISWVSVLHIWHL